MSSPPAPHDLSRALRFVPEGSAFLDRIPEDPEVGEVVARSGHHVVTVAGRKLHSGRDPVLEAQRHVASVDLEGVKVAVLLGYGSGHVARALAEAIPDAAIGVYEPNHGVLKVGLGHGPLPPNVYVLPTELALKYFLHQELRVHKKAAVVRWPAAERLAPAACTAAVRTILDAIARARMVHTTRKIRLDAWQTYFCENLPHLVRAGSIGHADFALAGRPAVVVAAGPSLDRNIEWLRGIEGHATILAVNTAATALDRAGITPTAVVCIESLDVSEQLADLSFVEQVPAFLEMTAHPNLWKLPFARRIAMCVDNTGMSTFAAKVAPGIRVSGGFCVANTAVALAFRLGAPEIVLVGSDLAYSEGRMYARGTVFEDIEVDEDDTSIGFRNTDAKARIEASDPTKRLDFACARRPRLEVPAWGGEGTVPTTRDFTMFRDWYAWNGAQMREHGVHCINATEGGASIPGWAEERLADVVARWRRDGLCDAPDPCPRLLEATARPATTVEVLTTAVEYERNIVRRVERCVRKGLAILGPKPDADLHLSYGKARKLHRLIGKMREEMAAASLAAEPIHTPLDELIERGDFTTTDLLRTLLEPVAAQDEVLARVLQSIEASASTAAPPSGGANPPTSAPVPPRQAA
ncbi:MAG: DUF115 domain-containing protein [Deltaproteobacteria bacterium]|nr:MAG: DUF115 domain-containing protein [Deltaproteobacteria bacterium]